MTRERCVCENIQVQKNVRRRSMDLNGLCHGASVLYYISLSIIYSCNLQHTSIADEYNTYTTPLTSRYASPEMCQLFSPAKRHQTWRELWYNLARAEKELGLDIPDDAIDQMAQHLTLTTEDWKTAEHKEKIRR